MPKLKFVKIMLFSALLFTGLPILANARTAIELPNADEFHAAVTIERGLSGVFRNKDHSFIFSGISSDMVMFPFDERGKTRDVKFGLLTDQKRIPLVGSKYPGTWRGVFMVADRLVAWDATMLQLLVMKVGDFKTILSATVPTDLLRPAADRGGEPTSQEISVERGKFREASRKVFGLKYTGIAEIPGSWEKGSGTNYAVSSRVAGYPLLLMNCSTSEPGVCMLARHCFLEGGPKISPEDLTGVAVMAESREVLMADSKRNEINVYKFNSCFDVEWRRTIKLPSRLPKITNMTIDDKQRLWVVTPIPDSFTDANIFYWEKEVWFKAQR
jgi:hypothetical protein